MQGWKPTQHRARLNSLADVDLTKILNLLDAECSELCRKSTENISPFRHIPVEKLPEFTWDALAQDVKNKAPTLYNIFSVLVGHNDHRNSVKKGDQHMPSICMSIATLLKERNREMCGVQSAISVALFASHVQKKVSKYCVCFCLVIKAKFNCSIPKIPNLVPIP